MLCPKCDYISFDHLETCAKCNNSLAETASLLGGTSVNAPRVNYLSIVIEAEQAEDVIDSMGAGDLQAAEEGAVGMGLEEDGSFAEVEEERSLDLEEAPESADLVIEQEAEPDDGSVVLEVPDLGGIEFGGIGEVQEQEGAELEVQVDDERETGELAESPAEAVGDSEQEGPFPEELKLDLDESDELLAEDNDSAGLVLEASALTLESDDDDQAEEAVTEETMIVESDGAEAAGQTGIDLGDIDLSDLVHAVEGEEKKSAQEEITENEEQGEESIVDTVPESDLHLSMESDDEDEAEVAEDEEREVDAMSELNDEPETADVEVAEDDEDEAGSGLEATGADAAPEGESAAGEQEVDTMSELNDEPESTDDENFLDLSTADDDEIFDDGLDFSVEDTDEEMVDLSLEKDDDK